MNTNKRFFPDSTKTVLCICLLALTSAFQISAKYHPENGVWFDIGSIVSLIFAVRISGSLGKDRNDTKEEVENDH